MKKKDVVSFDFRYKALNNEEIGIIEKDLKKSGIKYCKYEYKEGIYTLTIEKIDKRKFDPIFISNINKKLNLNIEDFDFFISFTTWEQIGGFSIPFKISDFIRIIGGEIQVSIVTFTD